MYSANTWRPVAVALLCLHLVACGGVEDDLWPSDEDQRGSVAAGSVGALPGQTAADFQVQDSVGNAVQLADYLSDGATPADAVVLYFTMWCPICLSHSDHMLSTVVPRFRDRGDVVYALVDYVSGSVALSRAAEQANGYAGSDFVVLADVDQALFDYVSGSVALSRAAEQANGYAGSDFVVLADVDQALFDQFDAAMGTIVVIGPDGVIRLNEDYRTGAHLAASLDGLLP